MKQVSYQVEKLASRKTRSIALLSVALVALLAVGSTLAFLSMNTGTKNNVFTPTKGISAVLYECAWDGGSAATPDPANPSGSELGVTKAKKLLPGVVAGKDPVIHNTNPAGGEGEYVGMRVTFQKASQTSGQPVAWTNMSDIEVANLMVGVAVGPATTVAPAVGGFTANTGWVRGDGFTGTKAKMQFNHTAIVAPQVASAPLFNSVTIIPTAGNAPYVSGTPTAANFLSWLGQTCTDSSFRIVVDGAATQSTSVAAPAAYAQLLALLPVA
ncbi:MAG: hypothetical protein RR917_02490 [Eggerthellaceae bacterium]